MINKVLQMSKSVDDEKVGISFQMPKTLKEKVDKLCEENGIKLTTFFNSLAQVAIDEHNAEIVNYPALESEIIMLEEWISNWSGGDAEDKIEYYNRLARLNDLKNILNER